MTDFFAYCVTASTSCDSDEINANYFDGWSIGGYILISDYENAL
jgi:hypothetical protein